MSFFRELAERVRERAAAPTLQTQVLPQVNPVPTQIGGIGSILPMQTITLPGGQTVQIPEINMEEVNANLLAAGIIPQEPLQAVTPTQPTPIQSPAESFLANADIQDTGALSIPSVLSGTPSFAADAYRTNFGETNPAGFRNPERLADQLFDRKIESLGLPPIAELDPNVSIPAKTPQTTSVPGTTSPSPGAEVSPAPTFRTADFQDADGNGIDDRDEMNTNPNLATTLPDLPGTGSLVTPPASTSPPAPREDMPFVPSVRQVATGLDPLTEQLLFGIGGEGGFIPGAMRAAEKTFFDEEGKPIVIEEQVAGFTPDQLRAAELARQGVGIQDRFISGAEGAFGQGIDALSRGFGRARGFAGQGLEATRAGLGDLTSGLSEQERISRGATGQFGQRLGGLGRLAARSTADFGGRLGESERLLRGTTGAYDPSLTSAFFDPFEDRVVQQTISDVLEQGAQADIAARAGDIARGGESAFGSRARLGASERQEALGRGLGEAIAGIRSRGFTEAQRTGLSEFARQRAAERAASSGLAGLSASRLGAQQQLGGTLRGLSADQLAAQQGLAGTLGALGSQRFAGQQALAGALTGLGGMESQLAQREQAAQFGLGSALQGLGTQAQAAQASDIAQLYGMGTQQQALSQAQLDAQRRNQLQAQQAPLAQYQALAPFVSMAPAGQFQTVTDFAPPPSPMQVGIGTGLSTLGALGNLYGGG